MKAVSKLSRVLKPRGPHSEIRMLSTTSLDPEQILESLDRHIIGQMEAKRCVAVAFRNRFRRSLLGEELQREIMPANILMKGPTGVGKTEIARRVASLAQAPFIKVEATRYTEIGIVGANVSSMIKDMLELAIAQERKRAMEKVAETSQKQAETEVLRLLKITDTSPASTKRLYGDLANDMVDVPLDIVRGSMRSPGSGGGGPIGIGIMGEAPEELLGEISGLISSLGNRMGDRSSGSKGNSRKTQSFPVKEALKLYQDYYSGQRINEEEIIKAAKEATEQKGIVFIDEIDKLAISSDTGGGYRFANHREGVQKELLSLLEGSSVPTKYGPISTNHILFIASGAFHQSAISDLLPELQGRLPVRVELKALGVQELRRILSEKKYNLVREAVELLKTEGVTLEITEDAIDEIARFAHNLNSTKGNIGARRLTAVMQTILEDISFIAHRLSGTTQRIDKNYVAERMRKSDPMAEDNLRKYIL